MIRPSIIKTIAGLILLLLIFSGCSTEKAPTLSDRFDDPDIRRIAEFQDSRSVDSLVQYLSHENVLYRKDAALSLGSVQDSKALGALSILLKDSIPEIRSNAAYAIGQLKDTTAEMSLIDAIPLEKSSPVLAAELEALGKVISDQNLEFYINFKPTDSLQEEGLMWGLYRLCLRGKNRPEFLDIAFDFLGSKYSKKTRLAAANFLSRSRDIDLSPQSTALGVLSSNEIDPEVRMALYTALRHVDANERYAIVNRGFSDPDYRVRISAIRAIHDDNLSSHALELNHLLHDENVNVTIVASSALGDLEDANALFVMAQESKNWRAGSNLLGSAFKNSEEPLKSRIQGYMQKIYESSTNSYEKANLIQSLSADLNSIDFLEEEAFNESNAKIIRSTSIQGISQLRRVDDLAEEQIARLDTIIKRAFMTGDKVMVFTAGQLFQNPEFDYKTSYEDYSWMVRVKQKMDPEEDWETISLINETIAYFNGEDIKETVDRHKPLDWDLIREIGNDRKLVINTSKGDITIQLDINNAPSSASNFYKLAKSGYFDGISFHRVVPNFVMQGGCSRGDGWGGLDYEIRSELGNQKYKTGSVGMASAGKDTEGSQWFICHSPTPHLDGSYSIFAQVTSGMEIVHLVEIGDTINSIQILD